jgi:methyltransferase family protein
MNHRDPDYLPHKGSAASEQAPVIAAHPVLEHAMAFRRSAVLLSAYELGIFAELAGGPRTADQLTCTLGLRGDTVVDLLAALTHLDLVEPVGSGCRLTVEAGLYLDPRRSTYVGPWLDMAGHAMREMAHLSAQLRAGDAKSKTQSSLADRMWADIAGILGAVYPKDCA